MNDRAVFVDGFLDKGAVVAGVQAGQNLGKGYTLSYDAAGRRIASERWLSNASGQSLYERSEYAYNDLSQVQRRDLKDVYRQSGANSGAAAQSVSAAQLDLVNTYDERGRVLTQTTYKNGVAQSIARSEYRGDNQKISERTYGIANGVEYLSQANYFAEVGMIDAAGNQTRYRYAIFHASGNLHQAGDYLTTYVGFETYKSENLKATAIGQDSGITNYSYNDRGDLLHVSNHDGKFRRYAVDGDGRMISAQVVATDNTQLYLNYQNGALANAGAISRGAITDTLVPISADYPAHAPSSYVVNQGDTLESIAQMVWGDRSMWYVIADANGLSDTLMVGSSLRIPNVVTSNRNDATTFKPYNPAEVIGDTITPPVPPKPKKKKCNAAASIVMVVVAVVATIFTAGAAAYLIAPATTAATVGGAVGAGMAAVSAAGVGVGISAGTLAVGAVAGSLASQAVGKAMGVVDKISWKQAAVAGLGSYIGAGIMDLAAGASSTISNAMSASSPTWGQVALSYGAQGVAGYTGSYIASKAVGLDTSFSWKNMAASAIGSIVAGSINQKSGFWNSTIRGQVSAHSSAWMRDKWFGGDEPDYGQVAADAFGNSLVDFALEQMRSTDTDKRRLVEQREIAKRGTAYFEDGLQRSGASQQQIQTFVNSDEAKYLVDTSRVLVAAYEKYGKPLEQLTLAQQEEVLAPLYRPLTDASVENAGYAPESPNSSLTVYLEATGVTDRPTLIQSAAAVMDGGARAVNRLVDMVGGEMVAGGLITAVQVVTLGPAKAALQFAGGMLVEPAKDYSTEKLSGVLQDTVFYGRGDAEAVRTVSDGLARFAVDTIFDTGRGVVNSAVRYGMSKNIVTVGPRESLTTPVRPVQSGEFSITDWGGYPEGVPKPGGTFRLLDGEEYKAARNAAKRANRVIRADQELGGVPVDIHEIKPVKFGGSPVEIENKVILPRDVHMRQVTPWWNRLQKDIGG
ncbi:LysM peptidoglycan-binding domain-containing protein [Pseudomonas wadenswilerensis]